MKRFEIIMNTAENSETMIKNPENDIPALCGFYTEQLQNAAKRSAEFITFEGITLDPVQSKSFQNISMIEQTIMTFLRQNAYPVTVRIVCGDQDSARLYKVVYNCYYSSSKAERLEDDRWD